MPGGAAFEGFERPDGGASSGQFSRGPADPQAVGPQSPGEDPRKMKPMDGKMKPMDGKMKPMDGKMKPMDGKMKPMDGKMKPVGRGK